MGIWDKSTKQSYLRDTNVVVEDVFFDDVKAEMIFFDGPFQLRVRDGFSFDLL